VGYNHTMFAGKTLVFGIGAAVTATVALIYLTPLKWMNLVEPRMNDIDPVAFRADFTADPEKFVFVDVRGSETYNAAHAKGSINHPIGTLFDLHPSLPRSGKTIVLICSSGRLAGVAYGFLERHGFLNLARIEGGVQAWTLAGLPLEGDNLTAPIPTLD